MREREERLQTLLLFVLSLLLPETIPENLAASAENPTKSDRSAIHRTVLGRNLRHELLAFLLGFAPVGSHPSIMDNRVPELVRSSVSITTAAMLGARGAANEDRREGGYLPRYNTYRPFFGRTPKVRAGPAAKSSPRAC